MSQLARRVAAALFASLALLVAAATPAAAQQQDGLVNVMIGDVTITDVNIGLAAQIAANVCGVKVGPVAVLALQVDRSGVQRTVCTIGQGATLTQN